MALTALKLKAIRAFLGVLFTNAVDKAENALESGHLISFSYNGDLGEVLAKVKASQSSKVVYDVSVSFNRAKVNHAHCGCARGNVGCHHLATAMLYINRNISVTDGSCRWSVRKKNRSDGKPIECLYRPNKKASQFRALSSPIKPDVWTKVSTQAKASDTAGLVFLLSPELEVEEEGLGVAVKIKHPKDVIFSHEYAQAENPLHHLSRMLGVDWNTIETLAEATAGQASSPDWFLVKQWRLTSSNFGDIFDVYQKNKKCVPVSLLRRLHSPSNLSKVKQVMWGREHESDAIKAFTKNSGLAVRKTGIWLHECGFLGASPDGIVDDAVVEVKCPWEFRNVDPNVALKDKRTYFVWNNGQQWVVNKQHPYWDQIMAQMLFSRRKKCFFIVWTTKSYVVIQIIYDNT